VGEPSFSWRWFEGWMGRRRSKSMDKLTKVSIPILAVTLIGTLMVVAYKSVKHESNSRLSVLFASDCFPLLNGFPDTSDADEGILLCEKLEKEYIFKESNLHAGCKNLYCLPGSIHAVVTIYEIVDRVEQQKIINIAKTIKHEQNTRSFSIEFYAKETGPSPPDQFLRKVRID
jgi:hypothetical protein